jgi:hypothetical protein
MISPALAAFSMAYEYFFIAFHSIQSFSAGQNQVLAWKNCDVELQ